MLTVSGCLISGGELQYFLYEYKVVFCKICKYVLIVCCLSEKLLILSTKHFVYFLVKLLRSRTVTFVFTELLDSKVKVFQVREK